MASKEEIKDHRSALIYAFCERLHEQIDDLYEIMVDGTDDEEEEQIKKIINNLNELNLDR